jgi:hypothetical protein
MAATPMTDGTDSMNVVRRQSPRATRLALLGAVAIALLVAVPLPALASSIASPNSPAGGLALHSGATLLSVAPSGTRTLTLAPSQVGLASRLPLSLQQLVAHGPLAATRANLGSFSSAFGAAGTGAAPLASHPAGLSGNSYFGLPCSTSSAISPINATNSTLLAAISTNYLQFSNSGGSFCSTGSVSPQYATSGWLATERSTDSGQTWKTSWLPQNDSWKTASSPLNGSIPGILFPVLNGGPGYASPSIAAANDGTVLLATQFSPGCWLTGCTNASSSDPAGIAVARSTDGGTSWINTTDLAQTVFFKYLSGTPTCTLAANFYLTGAPYSPSVAINPTTDVAIATWEMLGLHIDLGACLEFFSGTVQTSVSLNGGQSWSRPVNVTSNSSFNPQIAIGPAPKDTWTVLYQNFLNGTVDNSTHAFGANWAWTSSANNGTTWSTPVDVGAHGAVNLMYGGSAGPDSFNVAPNSFTGFSFTTPSFAIDTSPTSSHVGNEYVVWSDNQTPGSPNQGFPAIGFDVRAAGAPSWVTQSLITAQTRATTYFEPAISVAPDGTVWVTFYGETHASGDLNMYAVYSTDGGSTWSTLSEITTQSSVLANGLISIGDRNGLAATTAGTFATWMDCRSASCTNQFNETNMISLVEPVGFTATASGVNMTVTTNGAAQTFPLPGRAAWTIGSSHTVAVPGWLPSPPSSVESFVNFSGAVNSTSFSATFTYGGGPSVAANYALVPASFIAGTFSPNSSVSRLTIDGYNVVLHQFTPTTMWYNYSVASGRSYYLNASASNQYVPLLNQVLGTTPSLTTHFNVSLSKTSGWIAGRLTPANASLTIDGNVVAVNGTSGVYNTSLVWGFHWVNASGFGVTNYSKYVNVTPYKTATTTISLIGGWIKGTLIATYPGITVSVDGTPISSFVGVTFNQSYLGGTHVLMATATGYNTSTINIRVTPAHTTLVMVNLTNVGRVIGTIGPAAAVKVATLSVTNLSLSGGGPERIDTSTGNFKVNVTGDAYWTVTVKATGFVTQSQKVHVLPGADTSPVTITLVPSVTPNCTANNSCPQGPTNPSGSSGPSLLLIGGIIVLVVLVAAIAAVVLMRRRSGGGGNEGEAPADGSMGSPETPEGASETYGAPPPPQ